MLKKRKKRKKENPENCTTKTRDDTELNKKKIGKNKNA